MAKLTSLNRLNDNQIKNAKYKSTVDKNSTDKNCLSDGGGLQLLLKPDGKKLWEFRYASPSIKTRRKTSFGLYPTVTLADARRRLNEWQAKINQGIDPIDQKRDIEKVEKNKIVEIEKKSEQTVCKIIDKWLEMIETQVTAEYHKRTKALLHNNVSKYIGDRDIAEVEPMELVDVLKKKESEGYLDVTERIFGLCAQVWRYAVANRYAKHCITADIDYKYVFKKHNSKNYPHITDPKELKILLNNIDDYWGGVSVKCALKLLPYVFVRPSNIRYAKWSDIDFEKNEWRIHISEMKVSRAIKENSNQYFIVPLPKQAIELLLALKQHNGAFQWIFAGTPPSQPISDGAINMALKRMGYADKVVAHGFRHTAATLMNEHKGEHGFDADVIEKQMAHKGKDKIRATYNHAEYLKERKQLMQWWADYLDDIRK
jgi:integrase